MAAGDEAGLPASWSPVASPCPGMRGWADLAWRIWPARRIWYPGGRQILRVTRCLRWLSPAPQAGWGRGPPPARPRRRAARPANGAAGGEISSLGGW